MTRWSSRSTTVRRSFRTPLPRTLLAVRIAATASSHQVLHIGATTLPAPRASLNSVPLGPLKHSKDSSPPDDRRSDVSSHPPRHRDGARVPKNSGAHATTVPSIGVTTPRGSSSAMTARESSSRGRLRRTTRATSLRSPMTPWTAQSFGLRGRTGRTSESTPQLVSQRSPRRAAPRPDAPRLRAGRRDRLLLGTRRHAPSPSS
jgi:hypothetical protein